MYAGVRAGGRLPGAGEIAHAEWIEVVDTTPLGNEILALPSVLDAGERAALAVALDIGADLFLCDDRIGRRESGRLGIQVVGTLGILVQAKRDGRLGAVAPLITRLHESGFRASEAVIRAVLEAAEEALSEELPPP